MLVLARRVNERIRIPCVGATVQVVAIKPSLVRLGVEAPPEVVVLREEVPEESGRERKIPRMPPPEAHPPAIRQLLGDRLDNLTLGLAVLQRQLQGNLTPGLRATLARIAEECRGLHEQLRTSWAEGPVAPAVPVAAGAGAGG